MQCIACLWKQHWSYWRNPLYTAVRLWFTTIIALIFGSIFWNLGKKTFVQMIGWSITKFLSERKSLLKIVLEMQVDEARSDECHGFNVHCNSLPRSTELLIGAADSIGRKDGLLSRESRRDVLGSALCSCTGTSARDFLMVVLHYVVYSNLASIPIGSNRAATHLGTIRNLRRDSLCNDRV